MKIVFLIFFLGILFSFSILKQTNIINAQETDYNRAYSDYIFNLDLYKKAHEEYVLARASYLQSKTIASQTKAQEATAKMLAARDQVLINYLTSIRFKLTETNGVYVGKKDEYTSLLDNEVSWLRTHRDSITPSLSLTDLEAKSEEGRVKYEETQIVVYKSLALVGNGKLDNLQSQLTDLTAKLEAKVGEIKANGDKDVVVVERTIIDVKEKISDSNGKESSAWEILDKLRVGDSSKNRYYDDSLNKLNEGFIDLKDANSLLKQIIISIKLP